MKKTLLPLILFVSSLAIAGPGDTILVTSLDNAQMTWYGNDDDWGVFPDASLEYSKIYMDVTLGCATGGCSDWDYTVKIEGFHQTGEIDSTLVPFYSFTVDGNSVDTFFYSNSATYITSWDAINSEVDSTAGAVREVLIYGDTNNHLVPTDTLYVWDANFSNEIYDGTGNVIGMDTVPYDSFLISTSILRYQQFDVIDNYELGRFMTPYGGYMATGQYGFDNNWTYVHTYDVTDYALMFHDSVKIRAFYGGWSSGFSATVNFRMVEGTPIRKVIKMENLYKSGGGGWNSSNGSFFETNYTPARTITIDPNAKGAMVRVVPSGHGFVKNQNCAEFCQRDYDVLINGEYEFFQTMWRNDCAANPINPQAGTWQYNRANWCPGLKTISYDHDITEFITAGSDIEIDLDIEIQDMVVPAGEVAPHYIIEGQLFQYEEYIDTTTISELALLSSLQISPNPSTGNFVIESEELINKNTFISVYSMIGQIVYESSFFNNNKITTVDLSHLVDGMYLLEVDNTKEKISQKITIIH